MFHLSEPVTIVVLIIVVITVILAAAQVQHIRHLRHVDHTMLEWHYLVIDEEVRGIRRVGERFYDELDLVDWENAHPEVYKRPEKYPVNAWFD